MWNRCGSLSHSRTEVRDCCKCDDASQWGNRNSTIAKTKLLNRLPPKDAYMVRFWILTNMQNLVTIPHYPAGFLFPVCAKSYIKNVYTAFLGSSNAPQPRPLNRFSRTTRQTTRFRTRMCLFVDRKQKFNTWALLLPKNHYFWDRFWRDKIFDRKPLYNVTLLNRHRSPIVVIQWIGKLGSMITNMWFQMTPTTRSRDMAHAHYQFCH